MRTTVAFATFTLLVWGGRVRNVLDDASLDAAGTTWRLALAAAFVAGAVVVLALAARSWRGGRGVDRPLTIAVGVLAALTVVVWVVRGGGILLDDHDVAFKAVHTVLALASIGLALAAGRALAHTSSHRPRAGTPAT